VHLVGGGRLSIPDGRQKRLPYEIIVNGYVFTGPAAVAAGPVPYGGTGRSF